MVDAQHQREMGRFEQTLTGFESQLNEMKRMDADEREQRRVRDAELFRKNEETTASIARTDKTVATLAETVRLQNTTTLAALEAAEKLAESKLKTLWYRLGGGSLAGIGLGGWAALERFFRVGGGPPNSGG